MKKVLLGLLLLITTVSYAQQDPYYTHFKDVMQAYNPAAAGHKYGEICISGLTHHQWRDYDEDTRERGTVGVAGTGTENVSPVTYNLNVNTVFRLKPDKYIGAGITVIDDKVGFTKSTAFRANINYRQQFQGGFSEISGGLGIGGKQWGWVNPDYLAKDPGDPNIPAIGTDANETKFDLSLGLMYKRQSIITPKLKDFYAGFSITNINQASYQIQVTTQANTQANLGLDYVPHYYTQVGVDYHLDNGMVLEPAILGKYGLLDGAYKPQVDLNVTALFASTFRGGIGYRQFGNADALSVLLGYQTGNIKIGYSYDITLSNVQRVSNGTHEIFVRYCIPINVTGPSDFIRESVRFL
jgi:type IX secretion system PorP/SprF family membrane protein